MRTPSVEVPRCEGELRTQISLQKVVMDCQTRALYLRLIDDGNGSAYDWRRVRWRGLGVAGSFDGADYGAGFIGALLEFGFGDGVGYDAGAGLDVALVAGHVESADGDAGV